jgi:G3E family GTPase
VVIETTGLADPAPVLHTVMSHPYLGLRYQLEGVITVVDAVNGAMTLDAHAEAVKQAAVADRLILTKTDLAKTDLARTDLARTDLAADPAGLRARLTALNPGAVILDAATDDVTGAVLDCGLYRPDTKAPDVARWLADEAVLAAMGRNAHRHADGTVHVDGEDIGPGAAARGQDPADLNRHDAHIRAFAFRAEAPIPAASFELFQELLRSAHGPRLLRVKGLVKLKEEPHRPLVIHGVQHVFHPPRFLDAWPDGPRENRLVFITKDLEPAFVEGLWKAFTAA